MFYITTHAGIIIIYIVVLMTSFACMDNTLGWLQLRDRKLAIGFSVVCIDDGRLYACQFWFYVSLLICVLSYIANGTVLVAG